MCGIVGLFNPQNVPLNIFNGIRMHDPSELCKGMLGLIQHRGPDEMGILQSGNSFIANARLSIIDLASGAQPISNFSETIWIVYNGEIYDCEELRAELIDKGHTFKTRTDTEVIVHLYEEYGESFVEKLNGEYAFAIFDLHKNQLTIGRDRYGIRPLYYRQLEHGAYLFSSEIKPLLWAFYEIPPYEPNAFSQALESWVTIPPLTIYKQINQLPQNSLGIINKIGDFITKTREILPRKYSPKISNIKNVLEKAVKRRLVADVPVGVYLSGGLDSALISMIASKNSPSPLKSFSIEFESSLYDESNIQKKISEWLGTEHYSIKISSFDIVNNFAEAVLSAETVVFRTTLVPMLLLSKLVQSCGVKSVLTGEGADEVFGGYDLFKEYIILSEWSNSKDDKKAFEALQKLYPYLAQFQNDKARLLLPFYRSFLKDSKKLFFGHKVRWSGFADSQKLLFNKKHLYTEEALITTFPECTNHLPDAQCRFAEIATLLHGYLLSSQGDRMAAANSVETRLPFLDEDMTKIAMEYSLEEQIPNMKEKHLLKEAFNTELPAFLKEKVKQPFLAPDLEIFFKHEDCINLSQYFNEEILASQGMFDPKKTLNFFIKLRDNYKHSRPSSRKDNTIFFTILSAMILHCHMESKLKPKNISKYLNKNIYLQSTQ